MKRADVYRRGTSILVHSLSETTEGVWIVSPPCVRLAEEDTDTELGEVVVAALGRSCVGLPHPTRWDGLLRPLLDAARVKTWRTFVNNAVSVGVEKLGEQLELVPTENLGAKGGFEERGALKVTLAMPKDAEQVGAAVREALALAH